MRGIKESSEENKNKEYSFLKRMITIQMLKFLE